MSYITDKILIATIINFVGFSITLGISYFIISTILLFTDYSNYSYFTLTYKAQLEIFLLSIDKALFISFIAISIIFPLSLILTFK